MPLLQRLAAHRQRLSVLASVPALARRQGDFAHTARFGTGLPRVQAQFGSDVLLPLVGVASAGSRLLAGLGREQGLGSASAPAPTAGASGRFATACAFAAVVAAAIGAGVRLALAAAVATLVGLPYALAHGLCVLAAPRPANPLARTMQTWLNARLEGPRVPSLHDGRVAQIFAVDLLRGQMVLAEGPPEGAACGTDGRGSVELGAWARASADGAEKAAATTQVVRAAADRLTTFCRGDAQANYALSVLLSQTLANAAFDLAVEAKAVRFRGAHPLMVVGAQRPLVSRVWPLAGDAATPMRYAVLNRVVQEGLLTIVPAHGANNAGAPPEPVQVHGVVHREALVHLERVPGDLMAWRCVPIELRLAGQLGGEAFAARLF